MIKGEKRASLDILAGNETQKVQFSDSRYSFISFFFQEKEGKLMV